MTAEAVPGARRWPSFGLTDHIRKAREVAGLDQAELADELGKSRATISNWETGLTHPKRGDLLAIAMVCGVDAAWLLDAAAEDAARRLHRGEDASPVVADPQTEELARPKGLEPPTF